MQADERAALFGNIKRVQAQQQVIDDDYDISDYDGVYRLFMLAYGKKSYAEKMKLKALEEHVKRNCNVVSGKR